MLILCRASYRYLSPCALFHYPLFKDGGGMERSIMDREGGMGWEGMGRDGKGLEGVGRGEEGVKRG